MPPMYVSLPVLRLLVRLQAQPGKSNAEWRQRQTRIPSVALSARQSARGQNSLPEGNWTTSRESLMFKTGTGLTEYGTWSRMAVRGLRTRGEQSSMWACSKTGK